MILIKKKIKRKIQANQEIPVILLVIKIIKKIEKKRIIKIIKKRKKKRNIIIEMVVVIQKNLEVVDFKKTQGQIQKVKVKKIKEVYQ